MLRPWTLRMQLRPASQTPLYIQIVHALIEEIRRGRIGPKTVLPGSRALSSQLGVSRKTIIAAYDELVAQGWAAADSTRGTFVSPKLPQMQRWTTDLGKTAPLQPDTNAQPSEAGLMPWIERSENYLLFDDGTPDPRLAPVEDISRAFRYALTRTARRGELGYGDPRGLFALRQAISTMLNSERGLATSANNICVTRGSQMAIYLSAKLLIEPGDFVVLEKLTYPPARATFQHAGAKTIYADVDEGGIVIEDLERLCDNHSVRAVYLTPHHQFPTTVSLRPDRRLRLLELSKRKGFFVIEDDYDHEFHFDHQPLLPLASTTLERTVYIGSMSKLISPSLRVGYFVSTAELVHRASQEIMLIDRQGSQPLESATAEMMSETIRSHARRVHTIYKDRRDCLADRLRTAFDEEVIFDVPAGGLAFWVRFKSHVSLEKLIDIARTLNLRILPSNLFYSDGSVPDGLRLGFANLDNAEIREAVERLYEAYLIAKK